MSLRRLAAAWALLAVVLGVLGAGAAGARAEAPPAEVPDEDPEAAAASRAAADDDPSFGPLVTIERIEVVGHVLTAERLIRRALLIEEGDQLRTGDPRFRRSRFRVLALGYFVDVQLRLDRGSARGSVVVTVEVWERGAVVLDSIFLGSDDQLSPFWVGLDAGDGNFLGTGLALSGAVVWAAEADRPGARAQLALRLRYGDPSVLGLPLGVRAQLLYNQASQPVEFDGTAFDYERLGGTAGVSWDVTRRLSLSADLRAERVRAADDAFLPYLTPGTGFLGTLSLGAELDTRTDPVLTRRGDLVVVAMETGAISWVDYRYTVARARWQHWFPLRGERGAILVGAGVVVLEGGAPSFEWIYPSDFDRLLPRRPLGLTVSERRPFDLLGNSDSLIAGTWGGLVELEWRHRVMRRRTRIYGGDLFIGAGVYAVGGRPEATLPDGQLLELTFDAGLRLDTEIGIFELSLSNLAGRLPL